MELITTPAHFYANSYITLEEADSYFTTYDRVPSDSSWYNLTDTQKEYALILAAYALNTLPYKGYKVVRNQPLAFPRYSEFDVKNNFAIIYNTFDDAIDKDNLTPVAIDADIDVSNNQFVLQVSGDSFSNIKKLQVIKVDGFLNNSGFFTVKKNTDTTIMPYEKLTDEDGFNIDIYITPIPGIHDNIRQAQAEMAWQVINTTIFQKDIEDMPEPPIRRLDLGGVLRIDYRSEIFRNRFDFGQSSPLDMVYYLLSPWLTSVRGRFV